MHLHHLAFRTDDVARLRRFYEEILGLGVVRESEAGVWLRLGGAVIMIEEATPAEPRVSGSSLELVALAIEAGDEPAWRERLARGGVVVESETAFTLYFRDPDGRRVALSHYPLDLPR